MNSFLYRVAEVYYKNYNNAIVDFTFVFPNRRAGLFFQKHLSTITSKPIFTPNIITVNECFNSVSNWQVADKLSMLFRLYRIYLDHSKSDETFDSFVFWGEMLLSDFDEVDKYRIDAKQLFTNVTELKQIDEWFDVFSENQIEAIRQFWSSFVPVTEGKSSTDFIATWKILYPIYEQFRTELMLENTATEGMICRDVTDRLKRKEKIPFFEGTKFVFIGFNALNPCEKTLFEELQKLGIADFYWDYEALELRDSENNASNYYAENIHIFPSKFEITPVVEKLENKNIELIAVPSAVGQAKQVYALLNQLVPENSLNSDENKSLNTAIVLPDENLLIPLLHSIPPQIGKINVTMGFPMKSTPIAGFIDHIFDLQRRVASATNNNSFYHVAVSNILNHQYVSMLCYDLSTSITEHMSKNNLIYVDAKILSSDKLLSSIFISVEHPTQFIQYLLNILAELQQALRSTISEDLNLQLECDFIYQYYVTLKRMQDVITNESFYKDISIETLIRLIKQVTAGISIPFIGEPLDGLQVMGVLETRGLDFENLIVTSFNEGVFPQKSVSNSFIPYNLRRGFDLPTAEQQDAITSYNFYRLIHRAKSVFFLYDSRSDAAQTGEVSRFLQQLQYHYNVNIHKTNISYDIAINTTLPITVEKNTDIFSKMSKFITIGEDSKSLSASAFEVYINCPLKFYLTIVEKIEELDDVKENIEPDVFGQIFHKVMELIYKPFSGKLVQHSDIEDILKNKHYVDTLIIQAFSIIYFKKSHSNIELVGNNLLIASVIRKYIVQVLNIDQKQTPFKYIESESRKSMAFPIFDGKQMVNIKGIIDRVDEKNGLLRIIDYKTGSGSLQFKEISEAFNKEMDKRPKFIFQTFLYALLFKESANGKSIMPGVYLMREVFKNDFDFKLKQKLPEGNTICVEDFSMFESEFTENLKLLLEEIFDANIPFTQTNNIKNCQYCSFTSVCNR